MLNKKMKSKCIMFRKNKVAIFLVLVLALSFSAGCSKDEEKTAEKTAEQTATTSASKKGWEKSFPDKLASEKLLPKELVAELKLEKKEKKDEDSEFFLWAKWNKDRTDFKHNIQMESEDGELVSYRYKAYFEVPKLKKTMSKDEAAEMVKRFAKAFIRGGEGIEFTNKPEEQVQSLYDPGHVETWSGVNDGDRYDIVVDMDMGGVVLLSKSDLDDKDKD